MTTRMLSAATRRANKIAKIYTCKCCGYLMGHNATFCSNTCREIVQVVAALDAKKTAAN